MAQPHVRAVMLGDSPKCPRCARLPHERTVLGRIPHGPWRVSPSYDVACSHLYGDSTMAMTLNGRAGSDPGARAFVNLGGSRGVPGEQRNATRRALTDLADRADSRPALDNLPFDAAR